MDLKHILGPPSSADNRDSFKKKRPGISSSRLTHSFAAEQVQLSPLGGPATSSKVTGSNEAQGAVAQLDIPWDANPPSNTPTPSTPHDSVRGSRSTLDQRSPDRSLSRRSSTTQEYNLSGQNCSPTAVSSQLDTHSPRNQLQTDTPTGQPLSRLKTSFHHLLESPNSYHHDRTSPSNVQYSHRSLLSSPHLSISSSLQSSSKTTSHSPLLQTENSADGLHTSLRQSSASVSPKTIVSDNYPPPWPPTQHNIATPPARSTSWQLSHGSIISEQTAQNQAYHGNACNVPNNMIESIPNSEILSKPTTAIISIPPRKTTRTVNSRTGRRAHNMSNETLQVPAQVMWDSDSKAAIDESKVEMTTEQDRSIPYNASSSPTAIATPQPSARIQDTAPPNLKRPPESEASSQHPTKRRRFKEIPIWAQRAQNTTPLPKYQKQKNGTAIVSGGSINGHPLQHAQTRSAMPPDDSASGPLGSWEPCFTNVIPHEELTRAISDALFMYVVSNDSIGIEDDAKDGSNNGQLEIEAKLGTIFDRNTGERLRLPLQTEAMLADNCEIAFESTMDAKQHEHYNTFLNNAVAESIKSQDPPFKNRVPMRYLHTRETDTFYELPAGEISRLPPAIQPFLKAHKPRLRITHDQKTGKILAKIIKARIKDMHVYSPRTEFDWRISVSLEMNWDGDVEGLVRATEGTGGVQHPLPVRNKDRMSYGHLFYQIDLTQVKPGPDGLEATHELEVEIASREVRRQGKLVLEGKENQYEDLIKGFADNVRTLVRQGVGR